MNAKQLLKMSRTELLELMRQGHAIDPAQIADREYKGVSLGLPGWVDKVAWKKFKKVFCQDDGGLRGWNVKLEQNELDGPCIPAMKNGQLDTFGHYRVVPLSDYRPPRPIPQGLMLDYGLGGNARFDPVARVRDPVVALDDGSTELLLGWTYLDLGFKRVPTPSFFSLELDGPRTHHAAP